jgi:hypothetical protein
MATTEASKIKFRVRTGTYWDGDEYNPKTGTQTKKPTPYGPNRPAGDIVESAQELDKIHNTPGRPKMFQRLGAAGDELTEQVHEERRAKEQALGLLRRTLEMMSGRELMDFAGKEGIDLKGKSGQKEVLAVVLENVFKAA